MIPVSVRPAPRLDQASRTRPAVLPWVALAFAVAVIAVWATAAVRSAGHGFDVTDEGFYLLSYRWWNADHRTFTGVQYVYGPIFQLLGYDIAALRLVRLFTILAVHVAFGWSVMRWLSFARRPRARLWEAAGIAAITAAGGTAYGWLPLTPGYNDVVLLGSLLGMALVLRAAASRNERLLFGLGVLIVPILLAKWAALPVVVLLVAGGAVAVAPGGTRSIARAAAWVLGGVASAAAFVHLAIVPLTVALPGLAAVNRLLAARSMSLPTLLASYRDSSADSLSTVIRGYGPLLIAGAVAVLPRWVDHGVRLDKSPISPTQPHDQPARVRWIAWVIAVGGLGMAIAHAVTGGGLAGGAVNVRHYLVPFLAVALFLLVVGTPGARRSPRLLVVGTLGARRAPRRDTILLVFVAVLPITQALGSGNAPLLLAVNGFAAWMAVLIAILTGLDAAATVARALIVGVAAASLIATASVATGGLERHPYRTAPLAQTTATVAGVPTLASVRLDPATARRYADLHARLLPYLSPGRRILAFDTMAGVVFLLDGRSVGEPWYPRNDPARVAAGINAECVTGQKPILLFNRPIRPTDRAALAPCGLDLDRDYRLLAPPGETADLTVLVPAGGPA